MYKDIFISGLIGFAIAAVIGVVYMMFFIYPNNQIISGNATDPNNSSISIPADESETNTEAVSEPTPPPTPAPESSSWSCVDATSYNQNAYDDNKCSKGDEVQYVSDSQAVELDPNYSPGKSGAYYYNNQ